MTEWLDIPSFPGYLVSDDGQVCSRRGILSQFVDACGYYRLGLYRDGKRVNCRVHVLVADAFLGPRPVGAVIRHLDGNHQNNSPVNLQWGTQSENVRDAVNHGTQANIRKTNCPYGHPYDETNTQYETKGNRKCRTCRRDRERIRRARLKGNAT